MLGGLGAPPGSLLGPSYGDCVLSSMLCPGVASTCQGPHMVQQEQLLFAPGARGQRCESFSLQGNGSRSGLPSHHMGHELCYPSLVAGGMLPFQQWAALSYPGQDGIHFPRLGTSSCPFLTFPTAHP